MYNLFFRRAAAYLLDITLAFALLFVLPQTIIAAQVWPILGITQDSFKSGIFTEVYVMLLISMPIWLYFILLDRSKLQGTPGKKLLGLSVTDARTGKTITTGQSILRNAIKLLPWELAHLANNIPTPLWYDPHPSIVRSVLMTIPMVLLTIYLIYCFASKGTKTIHDLAAKTKESMPTINIGQPREMIMR
jgi:uncharacterized RDD family membrane protein YckC